MAHSALYKEARLCWILHFAESTLRKPQLNLTELLRIQSLPHHDRHSAPYLVYRHSHTSVVLGHGYEHIMIVCEIFCCRIRQLHMG